MKEEDERKPELRIKGVRAGKRGRVTLVEVHVGKCPIDFLISATPARQTAHTNDILFAKFQCHEHLKHS